MATSWSYGDWRRQSGLTAQRDRLILHIEEVEGRLADFQSQGFEGQNGARFPLDRYLDRLNAELQKYNEVLGDDVSADIDPFVQVKPRYDFGS